MIRSQILLPFAVLFFVTTVFPLEAKSPPNVVIVITDDQGYGDLGCHGHPTLKTPAIDALAEESVRLDDYHVAPTCSPTRCAFLTGHWTNRTGVWHTIMGRSMLRKNEVTVGQIFKDAGYGTGMFGKWHLGDNYPFRPEDRGFTEVLRHGGGGVGQTPDYWDNAYFDGSYFHNKVPEKVEGFCTDVFFRYAKDFISDQIEEEKPFFAYISTNAPHGPNHSPPEFAAPYEKLYDTSVAHFFGMIANIDHNVSEMRKFLEDKGVADNTIFIFTTDNGTATGRAVFDGGMRGAKGSEYDGGHRVPFFIHWPAGNLKGGRLVNEITAHVDVVPTLIDLCEVAPPKGVKFDGRSIRPLLENTAKDWPDRILVTDSQRVKDPIKWRKSSVMTDRWRLVNEKELYDIESDPMQTKNVYGDHPEVVQRLTGFYEDWWAELEPTFGDPARIVLGNPAENPTRLTSHDWITVGSTPWNQAHIRSADAKPNNIGFWYLEVEQSGEYEIEIRRWPKEGQVAETPIEEDIPAGADVPGVQAFRARPGLSVQAKKARIKIGDQELIRDVPENATHVTFTLTLEAGPAQLEAHFLGADGGVTGAYYAYVKKL
ncbi:MAG: arylsulfatase [Verrucomicrobiales bacterium]|nr:arylsulfatase [Verrucomicrobiales bacterium]